MEGVIIDYRDMFKDAQERGFSCATELPYFEGDYWPLVLEECIKVCE